MRRVRGQLVQPDEGMNVLQGTVMFMFGDSVFFVDMQQSPFGATVQYPSI